MAVNFCNANVGTLIECDQICVDGYDVGNLVSPDKRRCGFMVEPYVKPPVNILLTLPCPSELSCVVVGLVRGAVRLTGFEIWVSHTPGTASSSQNNDDFLLVAKKSSASGDVMRFRNRCYVPRGPFASLEEGRFSSGNDTLKYIYCKHVYRLKLKLVRAVGSIALGMGFLEVWGQPMLSSCSLAFQNELIRKSLASASHGPNSNREDNVQPESTARERTSAIDQRHLHQAPSTSTSVPEKMKTGQVGSGQEEADVSAELQIPADFQDALTYELMTQPVLLPSGQVVDQSALDKHVDREQKWGRPVTDPFTGVTLTGVNCPKSLPELKSRIDHFVLHNLDKLGNIPRTLGRNAISSASSCQPSGLVLPSVHSETSLFQASNNNQEPASSKHSARLSDDRQKMDQLQTLNSQGSSVHIPSLPGPMNKLGRATSLANVVTTYSKPKVSSGDMPRTATPTGCLSRAAPVSTASASVSADQLGLLTSNVPLVSVNWRPETAEKRKVESALDTPETKRSRQDLNKTHEERLADSLSSSLAEILQKIRGNSQGAPGVRKADDSTLCWLCKTSESTHRAPCGHHFCRSCLMMRTNDGECTCGQTFQSSEVVRVHS
ncbi:RING finger protein 37 [Amblyomma americanum]